MSPLFKTNPLLSGEVTHSSSEEALSSLHGKDSITEKWKLITQCLARHCLVMSTHVQSSWRTPGSRCMHADGDMLECRFVSSKRCWRTRDEAVLQLTACAVMLLGATIVAAILLACCSRVSAYIREKNTLRYFGTRTAYEVVRNKRTADEQVPGIHFSAPWPSKHWRWMQL